MQVRLLSQALFWGRKLFLRTRCLRPRWLFWPLTWPISRILNVRLALHLFAMCYASHSLAELIAQLLS